MRMLYLVRHCAYDSIYTKVAGRLPIPLSKEGVKQAEKLHDYFKDKNISDIYASPVVRCRQTAELISKKKIPISFDIRLVEVLSAYQGIWRGGEDHSPDMGMYLHRSELGGENFADLRDRMMSFYHQVIIPSSGNKIICGHAEPLWCFYLTMLNKPLTDEVQELGENGNPEYLQKGAIRPLKIEGGSCTSLDMILQKDL